MQQAPPPYPDYPPESRPLLRAVGVLLRGPLGVVVLLLLGVGALMLVEDDVEGPATEVGRPRPTGPSYPPDDGARRVVPPSPGGSVWVDSDVTGAAVVVGGNPAGVTPAWVQGVAPGFVRVAVSSRGVKRDTLVYLADGDDLDLSLNLGLPPEPPAPRMTAAAPGGVPGPGAVPDPDPPSEAEEPSPPRPPTPEPAPRTQSPPAPQSTPNEGRGELRVTAPQGTAVYLDGRFETRVDRGLAVLFMRPGTHRIRAIYPSLSIEETTVYVGRTIVVSLSFGPDPGQPGPGQQ